VPTTYTVLFSAFATISGNGSVSYEPGQDSDALKADVAARKATGQPVILSLGGSGGAKCGLGSGAQQRAFLSSVMPIIDAYGFSGIDWDIEAGIKIDVNGLTSVSRTLVGHYGQTFAVTMAPYGPTTPAYKRLARQLKDILTFVGYQFYNDKVAPTPDSVLAQMNSWLADTGIAPSQFALGFMPKDDSGKVTTYDTMVNIYGAVRGEHPDVRGVWTWAVGFD